MRDVNIKFATFYILVMIVFLSIFNAAQSIFAAWTAPTASPPGSNALLPIHVGTSTASTQSIDGSLGVSGSFLARQNLLVVNNSQTDTLNAGTNPGHNVLRVDSNATVGTNLQINGNLTVNGSANICKRVAYDITTGAVTCPLNYYITTSSSPTPIGEMICCKAE